MPNHSDEMPLSDIVARLTGVLADLDRGTTQEVARIEALRVLAASHNDGSVNLLGFSRERENFLEAAERLPLMDFMELRGAGIGAARLDYLNNSIQFNGGIEDFATFEKGHDQGWDKVFAKTKDVDTLINSLKSSKQSTISSECQCTRWLSKLMNASPDHKERSKTDYKDEALVLFSGLGARGFVRAWEKALDLTGAVAWSQPGPLKKQHRKG